MVYFDLCKFFSTLLVMKHNFVLRPAEGLPLSNFSTHGSLNLGNSLETFANLSEEA